MTNSIHLVIVFSNPHYSPTFFMYYLFAVPCLVLVNSNNRFLVPIILLLVYYALLFWATLWFLHQQ